MSQKARNQLFEYKKTLKCKDCGLKDYRVLDFDHINDEKETSVSNAIRSGWAWERIKIEIDKCEPVWANCHRIRTYKRRLKNG